MPTLNPLPCKLLLQNWTNERMLKQGTPLLTSVSVLGRLSHDVPHEVMVKNMNRDGLEFIGDM